MDKKAEQRSWPKTALEKAGIMKEWWEAVRYQDYSKGWPVDGGVLARLRRCESPLDVFEESSVARLARLCHIQPDDDLKTFGMAVTVLAHVREDREKIPNARALGPVTSDVSTAICKIVRFRRLLATEDIEGCQRAFRRIVALMGGRVNIIDMAASLLEWPVPEGRERQGNDPRVKWVYEYWNIGNSEEGAQIDSA